MVVSEPGGTAGDRALAAGPGQSGPPPPRGRQWTAAYATALVIVVYAALAVVVFWHIWTGHPTGETIGSGDSYMDSWFLAYETKALLHLHNPLFTVYGNYPYGINILDQSSQPLLGLLTFPVTAIFGPLASFNLLVTLGLAASATAAYFMVRRFVAWRPAAFVGGLLYGFSPYMIAQSTGHLNLSFAPIPPLVVLVLHDMVVKRRTRWVRNGLLLALLLVAQFFISTEIFITTVLLAVVGLVTAAIVGRRSLTGCLPEAAQALGLAAGCTLAVLAYPFWYAVAGPGHISGPIQLVAEAYRADLLGPIVPTAFQLLAPSGLVNVSAHFANSPVENSSYLGLPLIVLLVVGGLWLRRKAIVVVAAVTGLVAFVLSLGGALTVSGAPAINVGDRAVGGIPLPEDLLSKIGPLRNLIPVRFSLYVALFAGLLLGIVLDRARASWSRRLPGAQAGAAALALGAVALLPLLPAVPLGGAASAGTPSYFTSGPHNQVPAGSVGLVFPYPSALFPQAQAWQAMAGLPFKMPGGYFLVPGANGQIAYSPQLSYTRATPLAAALIALGQGHPPARTAALRSLLEGELANLEVRSVIAVPGQSADPAASRSFLVWLLGPPTGAQGGTVDWYHLRWPAPGG